MNSIFGNSFPLMSRALDGLWMRQEAISDNLSNLDTPGFKAKYVNFEEALRMNIEGAAGKDRKDISDAIESVVPQVYRNQSSAERLDGNNVDATDEMVEMTRATYQYQYLLNAVNQDLTRLRTVIKGV